MRYSVTLAVSLALATVLVYHCTDGFSQSSADNNNNNNKLSQDSKLWSDQQQQQQQQYERDCGNSNNCEQSSGELEDADAEHDEEDLLGFEAIRALHLKLDDDADGQVDPTESNEFLREELHYKHADGVRRLAEFHASAGNLEPPPQPSSSSSSPCTSSINHWTSSLSSHPSCSALSISSSSEDSHHHHHQQQPPPPDHLHDQQEQQPQDHHLHHHHRHHQQQQGQHSAVSVLELWQHWRRSAAHNWTVDETVDWLVRHVRLPQYQHTFVSRQIRGRSLPRMAVNTNHYLSGVLGIKDGRHKQKLMLMAMDAVLFGPPKESGSHLKDFILLTLLTASLLGCWVVHRRNAYVQMRMRKMVAEMDSLGQAETALIQLQKELDLAKKEKEHVSTQKRHLEQKLNANGETDALCSFDSKEGATIDHESELEQLRSQVQRLSESLRCTEAELAIVTGGGGGGGGSGAGGGASDSVFSQGDQSLLLPAALQPWLQLTYELELRAHTAKRRRAEQQLATAKALGDKLRRKQNTIYGSLVSMHGRAVNDVDESIVAARQALLEVTSELRERTRRWRHMERLCGFCIAQNAGLSRLEASLAGSASGPCSGSTKGVTANGCSGSVAGGASFVGLSASVSSQALLPRQGSCLSRMDEYITDDDSISAVISRMNTAPSVSAGAVTSSCGSLQCLSEQAETAGPGAGGHTPACQAVAGADPATATSATADHQSVYFSLSGSSAPALPSAMRASPGNRRSHMIKSFSQDAAATAAAAAASSSARPVSHSDGALHADRSQAVRETEDESPVDGSAIYADGDDSSDLSSSALSTASSSVRKSKRMFGVFKRSKKSKAA